MDALWKTGGYTTVFVGYRKSDRAILRHFLVLFYVIDDEKRVVHYSIVERQTSAIIVGNPHIRE